MKLEGLIGNTPMVRAEENLFLKVEFTNLTGSVKDRAALEMVLGGERRGLLRPGSTIIEATSGNMGISLAAIAAGRGYGCIIVMPETMSVHRRQWMAAFGARVVLTPGDLGIAGAVEKAKEIATQTPGSFLPGQFENPANALAHYRSTGPEIWAQMGGAMDVFVVGVGTGGTITGAGRFLKEKDPHIRVLAVEPAESPLLRRGRAGNHGIQGIGPNFVPKLLDRSLLDGVIPVTQAEAEAGARALACRGILAGLSAGAAYHGAKTLAQAHREERVVTLLPDSGDRYLGMGLFYDAGEDFGNAF